jgi:hypothetical protein
MLRALVIPAVQAISFVSKSTAKHPGSTLGIRASGRLDDLPQICTDLSMFRLLHRFFKAPATFLDEAMARRFLGFANLCLYFSSLRLYL